MPTCQHDAKMMWVVAKVFWVVARVLLGWFLRGCLLAQVIYWKCVGFCFIIFHANFVVALQKSFLVFLFSSTNILKYLNEDIFFVK